MPFQPATSIQPAQTMAMNPASPSQPAQTLAMNPAIPEENLISQIRGHVMNVPDEKSLMPIRIFSIPETLRVTKPEDYIPQQIAMGPYHHWRPELYEMELHKYSAARKTHERLRKLNFDFDTLVEVVGGSDTTIRSYYDRYLNIGNKVLAWMMTVDTSFLLEFLRHLASKDEEKVSSSDQLSIERTPKDFLIRDIIKLENQIPLFLLEAVLDFQCYSNTETKTEFSSILMGFCEVVTPFKKKDENFSEIQVTDRAHLLELLYFALVPETGRRQQEDCKAQGEKASNIASGPVKRLPRKICNCLSSLTKEIEKAFTRQESPFKTVVCFLSTLNDGPVGYITKPVMVVIKLPFMVIENLPPFSWLIWWLNSDYANSKDEIAIPSVSCLMHAGVSFAATDGGLSTVRFDAKTAKFSLPAVTLDIYTEVTLRNLVAYEAAIAPPAMYFTRYTELMNGIVDIDEDAAILRKRHIIVAPCMTDTEVASVWNGMRKSVSSGEADANHVINKAIIDVNKYYNSLWDVRAKKALKSYLRGSWQALAFGAAILLLLLAGLQAFCSVYTCYRWFGNIKIAPSNGPYYCAQEKWVIRSSLEML